MEYYLKQLSTNLLKVLALILLIFTIGACKKKYDYDCPKCPLIESISPDSGHFGDIVTINGQNLHPNSIPGGSLTIKFNGTVVLSDSILSSTPSSIRVRVPKGCGSGYVTVDTNPQEGFVNKGTGVHFEYLFRYRWVQKAHFEGFKRYNAVGFSINTRGYIGTGTDGTNDFKDFWQWNQTTNIWTQKADFGSTACSSAIGFSFSIERKGYIGTGTDTVDKGDFWEYDEETNLWSKKADFNGGARHGAIGFSIGTMGYISGGFNGSYPIFLWEWNSVTDAWTQKATFADIGRESAIGFSIGSKGYMGTGWDGTKVLNDFWEWDQATNIWSKKKDFNGQARYGATGFSIGTKGYIGLGRDGSNNRFNDFWEWDQTTNIWSYKTDFGGTARYGAIGFSIGNKGYIGTGNDGNSKDDFWEYFPY